MPFAASAVPQPISLFDKCLSWPDEQHCPALESSALDPTFVLCHSYKDNQYADSEQDIKENEAVRDWTGETAATIETLIGNRDRCKVEIDELEADSGTDDDWTDDEDRSRQRLQDNRDRLKDLRYGAYVSLLGLPTDGHSRRIFEDHKFRYALIYAFNGSFNRKQQR